jgi:nucleotide-binding universal stress UspA family protein
VPIDGSPQSRTAQEMAIFISKLFNSQVTLLHVVSNEFPALAGEMYSPREDFVPVNPATYQFPRTIGLSRPKENAFPDEVIRELTDRLRENGQTMLTESVSRFTTQDIAVKQKLVEAANTAQAIIDEAEAGKYDLVVLGNSGGDENEADLHLGSVAKRVSFTVKAPVIVVRRKGAVRRILVPLDGSPKEEQTLQNAVTLARASKAEVLLLHVQEKSHLKLKPELKEVGVQILNHASTMFQGVPFEAKLASGDPAMVIIETAEQKDIDLIVMRGGGLDSLRRVFLGSVSDHVLHHATVPLLLVK